MSHMCDKSSSEKVSHVSNKPSKKTDKTCCSASKLTGGSNYPEINGHCKRKRLKTRKERSHARGDWKETSTTKSCHHHCHQIRKDMTYFQNSCQRTSKKTASIASAFPVSQEPSIITDNRLIGHHGLFNHEVKSIDIERLLSEQSKYEESGQQGKEKSNGTSHLFTSSSHIPTLLSSDGLLAADADDVLFKKEADPVAKTHDDCQEAEGKTLQLNKQGSDITPGQRPQQHLDRSCGHFKSILSPKHCSHGAEKSKTKNANYVISEKQTQSQLTPVAEKDHVKTSNINTKRHITSGTDQAHKNQDRQTQSDGLNPNPLQLSSSPSADSFDMHDRGQDPEYVSKSVSAVAKRLCECLYFPLLKKRNLVSEIREVLLKSLQQRQGPLLQDNLLEVQKCVRFSVHPTQAVQDQEPIMMEEDTLLSSDTPVRIIRSQHFDWKSTPQLHQSLQSGAEWLPNRGDELLRPDVSPEFYLDFEPSGVSPRHLFVRSPTLCSGEKASAFEHWEKSFNKSKCKESVLFDSFRNNFMDNSLEAEESSLEPQYHFNNIQSFFPYQAQLQDGYSAEAMHLSQEQGTFLTERYSLASSFPAQIHQPPQSNHFQPLSQYSLPLAFPALRSHHMDMMHYPPSHMLDRSPAPPPSSLPSPEQWSFPPMRLY